MRISICIPTWEQNGKGPLYLVDLLNSIKKQTFQDFDVIISDQSLNDDIKNICLEYKDNYRIHYFTNPNDRGNGPANTNNSLKFAEGEIIKIMFQDDLMFDENALLKISQVFENQEINWLVSGCNHTYDDCISFSNEMIPYWNERIVFGVNTISSPSVLAFRNKPNILFDENLVLLMDCEMYYQMYLRYGSPYILEDVLVTNRYHNNQISFQYTKNVDDEIAYIKNKHNLN